jgi:hypothetical protein
VNVGDWILCAKYRTKWELDEADFVAQRW